MRQEKSLKFPVHPNNQGRANIKIPEKKYNCYSAVSDARKICKGGLESLDRMKID